MRPYRSVAVPILSAVIVAGCAAHGSAVPTVANVEFARPQIEQQQGAGPWTTVSTGAYSPISGLNRLVSGFDGALWYCDQSALDRFDMSGGITQIPVQSCGEITRDPNQNLYFLTPSKPTQIGQLSPGGTVSYIPVGPGGLPSTGTPAWVSDSNDNLWVAGGQNIWQVNPTTGVISTAVIQTFPHNGGSIIALAYGSDGEMWFSCSDGAPENPTPCIGEVTLDLSSSKIWDVPGVSNPIAASDGGIWFSEGTAVARMDTSTKTIQTWPKPHIVHPRWGVQGDPSDIYFVTKDNFLDGFNIRTHKNVVHSAIPGVTSTYLSGLAVGPDLNLWTQGPNPCNNSGCLVTYLDVYLVRQISTKPTSVSLGIEDQTPLSAAETHYTNGSFTATSTNTSVAQVIVDSKHGWTIEGIGPGSCDITVADTHGNAVEVPVTVRGDSLP